MNSQQKTASVQLYRLKASAIHFQIQLGFYLLILVSVPLLVTGWWSFMILSLYLLLTFSFVKSALTDAEGARYATLEIFNNPARLIWYHQNSKYHLEVDKIRVYHSRWFILLKSSKFHESFFRLLLVDNFESRTQYSEFRRWILSQAA